MNIAELQICLELTDCRFLSAKQLELIKALKVLHWSHIVYLDLASTVFYFSNFMTEKCFGFSQEQMIILLQSQIHMYMSEVDIGQSQC